MAEKPTIFTAAEVAAASESGSPLRTPRLKLHDRTFPVSKAKNEANMWLLDWQERNDLTPAEVVGFHGECLSRIANYAIREERGVQRGDEAPDAAGILDPLPEDE